MAILSTISPPAYTAMQTAGTPGVVSVTRALGPTGFASAVTGPFDVRIILTEEPAAFTCLDHILVDNGTAGAPVAGSPIEMADLRFTYAGGGYTNGFTESAPMPPVEMTSISSTW